MIAMARWRRLAAALTVAFLAMLSGLAAQTAAARADAVADFYRGRNLVLMTGNASGGGYDLYLRLLAEHLGKYVPGRPNVIVEHKGGAGGLVAMNYVYNVAPKDGSIMIMPFNYDPVFQLLRPDQVKYDLRQMVWLANLAEITSVIAVTSEAGVRSIEEARAKEVIMASSGQSSGTYIIPTLFNALIGTRFKVVTGYPGTAAMILSMERGETGGRVGSWYSFKLAFPDRIRDGRLVVLAQDGLKRHPDLPNVRLYQELTSDADSRQMIELMSYPEILARTLAFPPGVPEDCVAAIRQALAETLRDGAFLAAAEKAHLEIKPGTHRQIEDILSRLFATPPALAERTKAIIGWK
jgi:tripartite-type tricarboxylate transporter receptor subunit TctC